MSNTIRKLAPVWSIAWVLIGALWGIIGLLHRGQFSDEVFFFLIVASFPWIAIWLMEIGGRGDE